VRPLASCAVDERLSRRERRTLITDRAAELLDLSLGRVLAERAEKVAQLRARDA
jgi:hypothetical protein